VLGAALWRRLERWERVLLLAALLYFLWLGYGTQVPWAYRPRTRHFHYFIVLALPVGALLVPLIARFCKRYAAVALVGLVVASHALGLAAGGRWGRNVEVARALLAHARAHPAGTFLTDVATLNEMYALNAFRMPANVVCVADERAARHLLVNAGVPRERWQLRRAEVDAALVNHERVDRPPDAPFRAFMEVAQKGRVEWRQTTAVKAVFRPVARLVGTRGFMIANAGGEVVALVGRPRNEPRAAP
jgi:hypothetical protein